MEILLEHATLHDTGYRNHLSATFHNYIVMKPMITSRTHTVEVSEKVGDAFSGYLFATTEAPIITSSSNHLGLSFFGCKLEGLQGMSLSVDVTQLECDRSEVKISLYIPQALQPSIRLSDTLVRKFYAFQNILRSMILAGR